MSGLFVQIVVAPIPILFYGFDLVLWPTCWLIWRRKWRLPMLRTTFFLELLCQIVLYCFAVFSRGLLEHQYYWYLYMMLANLAFMPLFIGAAVCDYFTTKRPVV